jgi:hypothetical protein
VVGFCEQGNEPSGPIKKTVLLNYKFKLPKCCTTNTRYLGLEVCEIGKQALFVTCRRDQLEDVQVGWMIILN